MKLIKPDIKYLEDYRKALEEDRLFRPQITSHFSDPNLIISNPIAMNTGLT